MTFWCGSGSGSGSRSSIFVISPKEANQKLYFYISFSAYYFLKVHLHHFSKKKIKKITTAGIKVFLTIFA
jgi:hypothetical protein